MTWTVVGSIGEEGTTKIPALPSDSPPGYILSMADPIPDAEKALMKRSVDQWKYITGPALELERQEELRALTEEKAFVIASRLSTAFSDNMWIEPSRRTSDGLVEQQRLFAQVRNIGP